MLSSPDSANPVTRRLEVGTASCFHTTILSFYSVPVCSVVQSDVHTHAHAHAHTDWPQIVDDGLLDANQLLRSECDTCHMFIQRDPRSALTPKLLNVMVVSVQPERNIQLYPTTG